MKKIKLLLNKEEWKRFKKIKKYKKRRKLSNTKVIDNLYKIITKSNIYN